MQQVPLIVKAEFYQMDIIVDFQIQMAKETEDLDLDLDTVRKGVTHFFDNPNKGEYWLALVEQKVVASLLIQYEWSDWRNGNVLWVHSVYTLPAYRRKGIFSQMYLKLKEKVQQDESLMGIRLYVDKSNHTAQYLYKKSGMDAEHYELFEWLKS